MNWKIAEEIAAEQGRTMNRSKLRLMGPMHIAETREQARENVQFGLQKFLDYTRTLTPGRFGNFAGRDPIDVMLESGPIVIGTPDDAIATLKKLHAQQGDFGGFLHQCHDWADWEATKKSYELFMRFVVPAFNESNTGREASYDLWKEKSVEFSSAMHAAAKATFEKFGAGDNLEAAAKQAGMIGAKS